MQNALYHLYMWETKRKNKKNLEDKMRLTKKQFKELEKSLAILIEEVRESKNLQNQIEQIPRQKEYFNQLLEAQAVVSYYAYRLEYKF